MKSIHQRSQNRDKEDRAYTCRAPSSGYGAAKWAGRRPREAPAAAAGEETGRNAGRRLFEAACLAGGVEPPEELSSVGVASSRGAGLLAGGRRRARLGYHGARAGR